MSWPLQAKNIKKLQVELGNFCQARCPQCTRELIIKNLQDHNISNQDTTPYIWKLNSDYVTLEQFKGWLDKDEWDDLKLIDICGNYDEPCANPQFLEIVEWILTSDVFSKSVQINIATNGGIRNKTFWKKLGELSKSYRLPDTGPRVMVVFGIDGLEDTNHLYRRNVKWEKLQENFRTYIASGGHAHWQFIYFKHNEHQDELAKQRSIDEGFKSIKWRGSKDRPKVKDIKAPKLGKYEKPLENPTTEIRCKAIKRSGYHGLDSTLYISHQGWLIPCCWWGTEGTMRKIYKEYGHKYDVQSHRLTGTNSVQNALDGEWFSNLYDHIMKEVFPKCIKQCKENITNTVDIEYNKTKGKQ